MQKKRIASITRKIVRALCALIAMLVLVFLAGRYGWRLFGFSACESAAVEQVNVAGDAVEIAGYDPGLFPEGFLGYYAEEEAGRLYVGFRFSGVFGFFETGRFQIRIPVSGEIKEVYIKTSEREYLIWDAATDAADADNITG